MIRYIEEHQVFILETKSTQYAMCVRPDGHLEHLYYGGRSLDCGDQNIVGLWDVAHDRSLFETGNAIALDDGLTLESLLQELSSTGKGDVSEPFVCMTHANGSTYFSKRKEEFFCLQFHVKTLSKSFYRKTKA